MPMHIILSTVLRVFPNGASHGVAQNEKYQQCKYEDIESAVACQSPAAMHGHFAPVSAIRQPHV